MQKRAFAGREIEKGGAVRKGRKRTELTYTTTQFGKKGNHRKEKDIDKRMSTAAHVNQIIAVGPNQERAEQPLLRKTSRNAKESHLQKNGGAKEGRHRGVGTQKCEEGGLRNTNVTTTRPNDKTIKGEWD